MKDIAWDLAATDGACDSEWEANDSHIYHRISGDLPPFPACDMPGTAFRRWTKPAKARQPDKPRYVTREPMLEDLLAEPIIQTMMRRDGVTDAMVRDAMGGVRRSRPIFP